MRAIAVYRAIPYLLCLVIVHAAHAQLSRWEPVGIGGGGALFASSMSPHNQNEIYVACDMSEVFHTTDFGTSWNVVDFRQLQGGNIRGAVRFTSDPKILYTIDSRSDAGTPVKSTNGGATWKPLVDDPTDGEAYALFADPAVASTVLLSDYANLYVSTDGGQSFALRYSTKSGNGLYMAGVFFDGARILVGTNLGLLASLDGGKTFELASTIAGIPAGEAMVSFAGAKEGSTLRLFCVTLGSGDVYPGVTGADYSNYRGIYRIDENEQSWTKVTGGIPSGVYPFFIDMARTDIDIAYVAGGSDAGAPVIFKTTNAGKSWQAVFKTVTNQNIKTGWSGDGGDRAWSYGEYALGFAVSPVDPNRVIMTDLGFAHVTDDGGSSWRQAYVATQYENPANALIKKVKPYKGIGLENTTSWCVAWGDSNNIVGCFADIRGIRSSDGGATWLHPFDAFNFNATYYAVTHPVTGMMFAATSTVHDLYQSTYLTDARIDGGSGSIIYSTNKGATWNTMHDFGHPVVWMAIDPNDPNKMYTSVVHSTQGGIYVTSNINDGPGAFWKKLATPPRTQGHPLSIRVLNDGTLVCSYSGRRAGDPLEFTPSSGVFVSMDGGKSWEDRSAAQMQYWTKDVVIDPHDPTQNTWYAGVWSGWGGAANQLGGLYKTTNQGLSWTLLLDLPSKETNTNRVTSCTVSPTNPNEMYVTTETDGLWYTGNLKAKTPTFTQVEGYPFRQPERVFYNPYRNDEVWVTSFGNGMRRGAPPIPIPAAPALIAPANNAGNLPLAGSLQWSKTTGAVSYDVQLSDAVDLSLRLIDQQGVTALTQAYTGLIAGTTYYWRVRAANEAGTGPWSEVWSFTTLQDGPAAPVAPRLVSPAKDSAGVPITRSLWWSPSSGATAYRIQLATSPDFSTPAFDWTNVASTTQQFAGLAYGIKHYWRVMALNAVGESPWSEVWSFTTMSAPAMPSAPLLASPPDQAANASVVQLLAWHRAEGATDYRLRVSTDATFASALITADALLDTSYTCSGLAPNTTYFWRVDAGNSAGRGLWSQTWSFTTTGLTGVERMNNRSVMFGAVRVFPNPASTDVSVEFQAPRFARVSLRLVDEAGKEVARITDQVFEAGSCTLRIPVADLPGGVYYYELRSDDGHAAGTITIVR